MQTRYTTTKLQCPLTLFVVLYFREASGMFLWPSKKLQEQRSAAPGKDHLKGKLFRCTLSLV